MGAAGAILAYLQETQKTSLGHIRQLPPYRSGQTLEIDAATRRSLELTHTMRDRDRNGSLLAVLDETQTPMGARRLAAWLSSPLKDKAAIELRQGAVAELLSDNRFRTKIRQSLSEVYDLERLLGRIATGRASPRDLRQVGVTLSQLPGLKACLVERQSPRIVELEQGLLLCESLREQLLSALCEECPLHLRDGGFVRDGFNSELDELRQLASGGKQWIAEYQAQQIQQTGITSQIGRAHV